MVLELWAIAEERFQFNIEKEYKHELSKEFLIFDQLKSLYVEKIIKVKELKENIKTEFEGERNMSNILKGMPIISQIKNKLMIY